MEMRREFVVVGAMTAARHRDAGAVSGGSENGDGGDNLSTREPKRSLVEVERSGTSTNDARTWKDVGIKRRTQGGQYGRRTPPAGRV